MPLASGLGLGRLGLWAGGQAGMAQGLPEAVRFLVPGPQEKMREQYKPWFTIWTSSLDQIPVIPKLSQIGKAKGLADFFV